MQVAGLVQVASVKLWVWIGFVEVEELELLDEELATGFEDVEELLELLDDELETGFLAGFEVEELSADVVEEVALSLISEEADSAGFETLGEEDSSAEAVSAEEISSTEEAVSS